MITKQLVSLVVILAFVFAIANVSAFGTISSVEINDGNDNSVSAGEVIKVRVGFTGYENATDVRLKVWLSGSSSAQFVSERFDVYEGDIDSRTVAIQIPSDVDPYEVMTLYAVLESRNSGQSDQAVIPLNVRRESYVVDVLDVSMDSKVQAGENLGMNIVLKNRGSHLAEDTFVTVRVPSLGIEERAYFGDLSAVDQSDPEKEDAVERRMLLRIPSDARPGIYTIEFEAFNGDTSTTLTKKVVITGASEDSQIISSTQSKNFAVGESASYTITLVNAGNRIKVYTLDISSPNEDLSVSADETTIAVPAGSSKTVKLEATADKAGRYNFDVNVMSGEDLVKKQSFVANVEGSSTSKALSGNTAVVLTVILAIIFVVLLVVLIVLLTRKPEKQKVNESYY